MSKNKEIKHITKAIAEIAKAQVALSQRVDNHDVELDGQAEQIKALETQVRDLRDRAIHAELMAGTPGTIVAGKYDLSPGRISQIKTAMEHKIQ